jgi:hypothetical protein
LVGPNLLAKGEQCIFALGDCASLVPEGAERPLPSTAQVANQQALHLVRHLPAWLRWGKPMPLHQPVFIVDGNCQLRMTPRELGDHRPQKVGPKRYRSGDPQPTRQARSALGNLLGRFGNPSDQLDNPLVE